MPASTENENILAGVNQVVQAIKDLVTKLPATINVTTFGGPGGCGCSIPDDTIIDPPAAPDLGDPETDDPPEGFDTWEDYNAYKCKAANKIIDELIAVCNRMASIPGLVSGMGAGLMYLVIWAAFFGPHAAIFAADSIIGTILLGAVASATGIAIILAALTAIVLVSITALAYFEELASAITSQKQDFVCGLYNAGGVEAARSDLYGRIDTALTEITGITEFISDKMNEAVQALLGTAVLNLLFEPNAEIADYVGSVDCSVCDDIPGLKMQYYDTDGSLIDAPWGWEEEFEFTALVQPSGFYYLQIFVVADVPVDPAGFTLEVTAISNSDSGSCGSQGSTPGTYDLRDPSADWLFGCTNSFAPSLTATAHKPV